MKKEFIPYEQALELKELGFNDPCHAYYEYDAKLVYTSMVSQNTNFFWVLATGIISAPLYQQAFRWFREKNITKITINKRGDYIEGQLTLLPLIFLNKYQIHVISPSVSYFSSDLTGKNKPFYAEPLYKFTDSATSYEEAELACLKKLIQIAKNQ